jgi:zinc transport system substrate-binding protein
MQVVMLIEKSLSEMDNKNSRAYEESAIDYIGELKRLDNMIRSKISYLKKRDLIVSHPSWTYFADEYGLTQTAIEQEGKEIQAKSMVKLIKFAKEKNIKAVFVQSQFNAKAAKVISKEIGAEVFELDPLAFNYIENMNDVTDKILKGLSND